MSTEGVSVHQTKQDRFSPGLEPQVKNPKMENAAHQFEASLMQELFAPLQKHSSDSEDESSGGDALMSFASAAMARAISDAGGFGIARQIISHFNKLGMRPLP